MESVAMMLVAGALLVIGGTWLAPKIRMAGPILLVLVGIACSLIPGQAPLEIEPEWILTVVLPPILYAAAVNVPMTDFRRNFLTTSGLSVGLVLFSAVAVGFLLTWLLPGLPLAAGIALGAVVAPPDAVAATSIGKRLGLPPRLVSSWRGRGSSTTRPRWCCCDPPSPPLQAGSRCWMSPSISTTPSSSGSASALSSDSRPCGCVHASASRP